MPATDSSAEDLQLSNQPSTSATASIETAKIREDAHQQFTQLHEFITRQEQMFTSRFDDLEKKLMDHIDQKVTACVASILEQ